MPSTHRRTTTTSCYYYGCHCVSRGGWSPREGQWPALGTRSRGRAGVVSMCKEKMWLLMWFSVVLKFGPEAASPCGAPPPPSPPPSVWAPRPSRTGGRDHQAAGHCPSPIATQRWASAGPAFSKCLTNEVGHPLAWSPALTPGGGGSSLSRCPPLRGGAGRPLPSLLGAPVPGQLSTCSALCHQAHPASLLATSCPLVPSSERLLLTAWLKWRPPSHPPATCLLLLIAPSGPTVADSSSVPQPLNISPRGRVSCLTS